MESAKAAIGPRQDTCKATLLGALNKTGQAQWHLHEKNRGLMWKANDLRKQPYPKGFKHLNRLPHGLTIGQ